MSLLESLILPLGMRMPEFRLKDPSGRTFLGRELYGQTGLLVIFTCNHCPYAQAVWPRVVKLGHYLETLRMGMVAINPNIHPDYPDDSPAQMQEKIDQLALPFPYLVDDTQEVAKSFKAQCTPDIYLFDKNQELVYHGRIDDNWKNADLVTREELKEAIDNMVNGIPVAQKQYPSMGCSIKWKD